MLKIYFFFIFVLMIISSSSCNGEIKKCSINIGHRLGGGLEGLKDNRLESAKAVVSLQSHKCFSHWEFDINSTYDSLVIFHDIKHNGEYLKNLLAEDIPAHSAKFFIINFTKLNLTKKVHIDLKYIEDRFFTDLISLSRIIEDKVPIHFRMSLKRAKKSILPSIIEDNGLTISYY